MNMISRPSNVREPLTNKFHLAFLVLAWAVVSFPAAAWSADQAFSISAKSRKTVAAGFGFQDAESSSITVKTYDAETGQVLSADTYELDIKDDGPPSSHPPTRIFAGGVGVGVGVRARQAAPLHDHRRSQHYVIPTGPAQKRGRPEAAPS